MSARRLLTTALLAMGFLVCLSTTSYARTITVTPDDGPNALELGVAKLSDGDRLLIRRGDYAGQIDLKGLTRVRVDAEPGTQVLNSTSVAALSLTDCSRVQVRNLAIRDADGIGVLIARCSRVRLERLVISGTTGAGVGISGSPKTTVKNCILENVANGIEILGSPQSKITRCVFQGGFGKALTTVNPGDPDPSDGLVFSRNSIRATDDVAVTIDGRKQKIVRNEFVACLGGVTTSTGVDMSGTVISKNSFTGDLASGIDLRSAGIRVVKNGITVASGVPIQTTPEATESVISRNVIDGGSLYSIHVRGDNSRVERNVVTDATSTGIQAEALNGRYVKNSVMGSGTFGFLVFGTGNTFVKNQSMQNQRSDFASVPSEGENTLLRNKFGQFEFDLEFK